MTLEQYEDWALGNLTSYQNWSSLDSRVVGFNPWHLLDRPVANASACDSVEFGCCEVGLMNMSRLHRALVSLGRQIVQRSSQRSS